ncbi:G2/mitotic-specific cyclin [Dimargaris verticillata]|uniref:G2/mitotic-specific cyclin n=1 Tax=Dimargaris verticillata TaxID=2761393 RepID=A0A9W8B8Q7_9FUNG|nr:G2/mitotic-specific cyclin [Dimargaris verticillata]
MVYHDENSENFGSRPSRLPGKTVHGNTKTVLGTRNAALQPKNLKAKENMPPEGKGIVTRKRTALTDVSNTQAHHHAGKPSKARASTRMAKKDGEAAEAGANDPTAKSALTKRRGPTSGRSRSASIDSQATVTVDAGPGLKRKSSAVELETSDAVSSDSSHTVTTEHTMGTSGALAHPRAKRAKVQNWDDLDAEDIDDPLMVSEYVHEIFDYMRNLEITTLPNPAYMDQQKELAWKMRGILVDWLIEVHNKFQLLGETLYLTVNLIDRFLSMRTVSLVKLQLVGITSMFVSAKYEEIMAPSVDHFIFMTDGGYKPDEVLVAERYLLKVLKFDLSYPNPLNFLRRVSKADNYDIQTRTIAKYFMEISLVDHRFLPCPPSLLAAAGTYLARRMLDRGPWDANLIHYSGYSESELMPCVDLMIDYIAAPVRHESFFKKYASKKFFKVSIFAREWVVKHYPTLVATLAHSNTVRALDDAPLDAKPSQRIHAAELVDQVSL